jgi:pyridoxine 4-dehydrogenase
VVLNWTNQKGFLALVGIRSVDQVRESAGAMGWSLSSAELEAIDKAADRVPKTLIQNPNQSK